MSLGMGRYLPDLKITAPYSALMAGIKDFRPDK
jgi:hypothetical protein